MAAVSAGCACEPNIPDGVMSLATEYDRWHQGVFESDPEHADGAAPWYRLVLEYLGPVRNKRVLEIACGRGGFCRLLAERGAIVSGADFSGGALHVASSKTRGNGSAPRYPNFTQADAQQLPFASGSFDVVVSCETIEHLPDPRASLAEMARVCRPSGRLYLTTPNYANATGLYYIYARGRKAKTTPGGDQPFDRVFLFPQIRRMVRQAGWDIIRNDGTVHQFPVWPGHNPVRARFFESSRIIRRMLSSVALHYFVMAQKASDRR
jgi:2-polyprenyl-3-methyl-5-hydroxy-6-metoxy-1,4-benzoquinol methylase